MNRESFLETLKQQYAEDIHEVWIECDQAGTVDFPKLNRLLVQLMKNAKIDGLSARDFEDLVRATLPDATTKIDLRPLKLVA